MWSSGNSRWSLQPRHRIKPYRRYCQAGRYKRSTTRVASRVFYRLSSGAERQAHNLEVVGSKPTGGSNPILVFLPLYRSGTSTHRHNHFKPLPRRTFYRLTPTLLMTHHHWSDSRMVIFLFITRTVWDRYLQVALSSWTL